MRPSGWSPSAAAPAPRSKRSSRQAGVSSVTFYEFFAGKEECFVAAFDRAVEESAAELERAAAGDPAAGGLSWPEQVATGLRRLTALVAGEPERARLCLVEAQTGGPELSARFEAALDRVAAKLREGRAPRDGAGRPARDPRGSDRRRPRLAACASGSRRAEGEELEALYPELIDIALAPYLGAGGSRVATASAAGDG